MADFGALFQEGGSSPAQVPEPSPAPLPVPWKIPALPAIDGLKTYLAQTYGPQFDDVVQGHEALKAVDNDAQAKQAVAVIAKAKSLFKDMEAERKKLTGPIGTFKSKMDGCYKLYMEVLAGVEIQDKGKLATYQARVELKRRQEEEAARKEAERLQAEINKEAAASGVEAPTVCVPVVAPQPTTTRTEEGTASVAKSWDFEVEDLDKVPREYLMLDDKKVRREIKDGVREIPGLRIFEKGTVKVRTK